jgi:hypothetical protein
VSVPDPSGAPAPAKKPVRRLRPEVAAEVRARARQAKLDALYERPVQDLDRDELAKMKAAFFRG